ncbi:Werner helicase interacting protein 1, partial [Perkinsus olseni]
MSITATRYTAPTYRGYVIGDVVVDGVDVLITLRQPLGEEAFEGLAAWSQVWLYYLPQGSETTVDYEVMDILSVKGRVLRLRPIEEGYSSAVVDGLPIIDIKPYHALDAVLVASGCSSSCRSFGMGSRAPPTKRSRCSVGQQGMRTLDSFFAKKETASHTTSSVEAIDIEASQSSSGPDSRHPRASEHPSAREEGCRSQALKPKIALRPKSSACRTSDSRQGGPLAQRARPTSSTDLVYEAGSEREGTGNSVGGSACQINYYEALPSVGADAASASQHQPAVPSMILWGPPGCGKTTLAQLLCRSLTQSGLPWRHTKLSAVNAGVND